MLKKKRLFLLDAYALIFRGYYAFINRPLSNGIIETSAIFGFVNSLFEILRTENPDHIAVCFDKGGSVERSSMYPEYKTNRPPTPEGILEAVPYIYKILEALKIPILEKFGYEADDVIGTLAQKAEKSGFRTYMVTPDKDFAQLVTSNIWMYKPARSRGIAEIWDVEKVKQNFEIQDPKQVIDYLAMMGDSSDNIPGLPGVGTKTAKVFLKTYGSIENLLKNTHQLRGKLKERIEANKELGLLSKKLATININVPIDFEPEKYVISQPDYDELQQIFSELQFNRLINRVSDIYSNLVVAPPKSTPIEPSYGKQMSLFDDVMPQVGQTKSTGRPFYQSITTPKALKILINLLNRPNSNQDTVENGIAIKVLIDDPNPLKANVLGLSFCFSRYIGYYVHMDDPTTRTVYLELLRNFFETGKRTIVTYDAKLLIKVLRMADITIKGPFYDVMLAGYVLDPGRNTKIDALSNEIVNMEVKNLEEVNSSGKFKIDPKGLSILQRTKYVVEQADAIFRMERVLKENLKGNKLQKIYTDIELPILEVLSEMELIGVSINTDHLKEIALDLNKDQYKREEKIYAEAGKKFSIGSTKELGNILFESLRISEKPKKTKTGLYATNETELSKYRTTQPIVSEVLDWRSTRVLLNTFVEALPNQINSRTNRVHTVFEQAKTSSGRLSSRDPNLQNVPIRDEKGRQIRKAFVPKSEDYILLAADYSQIELRIMASLSDDEVMMKAFWDKQDIHQATAAKVFGVPLEQVTKEQRSKAKAVNFGIIYGSSAQGLVRQLGISSKEAKDIMNSYFETYPNIKKYMDQLVKLTREKEYAETVLGRRRYFRKINSSNPIVSHAEARQAINMPIQGSAADIIKLAMLKVLNVLEKKNYKTKLLLQVHDELIFEVPRDEKDLVIEVIRFEMESAFKLKVPLIVDVGIGENWLEAH